ncbi:MBOAT family O-acyltransferase [Methylomonas methanica]|uniref:Probable alginate O-acetylase n=1 Tax=Methylomonas methanica (strain DSM 25384 / MC09) TaxID=857087 RepID=F9ZWD1_METMM|nr:MBOAT family protein [Methylomonas methanica]AEF99600.1 membrane bound O-acyl transferase MBOAT family protein [Methylomonas methanica MC09]
MLFNSHVFIFLYLPLVAAGFFAIGRVNQSLAAAWLAAASLFFYAWWSPKYLILLLGSIIFNFVAAAAISQSIKTFEKLKRRWLLTFAITVNLILLGYYKYANFFLESLGPIFGITSGSVDILLPLGISFFTFTQIAFLVDAFQGKSSEPSFIHYCLFVTYFPHLIAGPVLHHKEMMPQFRQSKTYYPSAENFSVGVSIFSIGLFKKVVIADSIAPYANAIFEITGQGYSPTFFEAWGGALAYTLQLYFDFSGYSDMAIGLSRLFNVVLPLNFNSPYKANNIIEFWRCWHMTLSRFLRDYLYIPLGGNRYGPVRRYCNLLITMLLGGLWHGAGWTFIVWGGLHGLFLMVNHAWQCFRQYLGQDLTKSSIYGRLVSRSITFLAVVASWVVFRSVNLDMAESMLRGMAGMNGIVLHSAWQLKLGEVGPVLTVLGVEFGNLAAVDNVRVLYWLVILVIACWMLPNTQEVMARFKPALDFQNDVSTSFVWKPTTAWGVGIGLTAALAVLFIARKSEFLYFQF